MTEDERKKYTEMIVSASRGDYVGFKSNFLSVTNNKLDIATTRLAPTMLKRGCSVGQ